jgi:hypothetical protein
MTKVYQTASVARNGSATSSEIIVVTPDMAKAWLERNPNNRRINERRVVFYAAQMSSGSWKLTHQGIAFDEFGNLVDGQHRLHAVVRAGVSIRFFVFRGVSRENMIAIDTGRPRSSHDAFALLGDSATQHSVAITRLLIASYMYTRGLVERFDISYSVGNDKLRIFHKAMTEAIAFSQITSAEKGLRHACVSAAIASAYMCENRDLLTQFKDQFLSGVIKSDSDIAASKLRSFMMSSKMTRGGREARADLFMRSCTALRAYLDRRPIQKLYATSEAIFHIPDVAGFIA